jgi:hypothetical protein
MAKKAETILSISTSVSTFHSVTDDIINLFYKLPTGETERNTVHHHCLNRTLDLPGYFTMI